MTKRSSSLPDAFARWAERTPDAVAVTDGLRRLTYAQLDREARRIAHRLRTRFGVAAGERVAVELTRSVETIAILLGVLRAGATYVPLDPADPEHRRSQKLEDAECSLVVSDFLEENLAHHVTGSSGLTGRIDADLADLADLDVGRPQPSDLACLMYTSGSTGVPKAVAVEHGNIWNLATDCTYVDITPDDVVLHMAPIAFDASHFEIWVPLLNGATVHVAPPGPLDPDEITDVVLSGEVTVAWLTAALFHLQIDADPTLFGALRVILAGGDVLSVPHLNRLRATAPRCRVINGYGPTETTTFATCHELRPSDYDADTIPIGIPIQGVEVIVADEDGLEVADGECGELWIGGAGTTRGYWRRSDLTQRSFVWSESRGRRFYRSGDLGYRRPDGRIEFRGRVDGQCKLRGFRVEPGEIEAALTRFPQIAAAAVAVRRNHRGEPALVAWVAMNDPNADMAELRAHARGLLPDYMIPSAWVRLEHLRTTSSGKIDRQSLPDPSWTERETYGKTGADARAHRVEPRSR